MASAWDSQGLVLAAMSPGDELLLALTDSRRTVRFASIPNATPRIEELHRRFLALTARARPGEPELRSAGASAWCEFGALLSSALLPAPIAAVLRESGPRPLTLQLEPALAWLPWELAFDGDRFLGERFAISRQLVVDDGVHASAAAPPRHGPLQVSVLVGLVARPGGEDPVLPLIERLRTMDGVAVSVAHVTDVRRDELLDLVTECDVLHCLGTFSGRLTVDGPPLSWRNGELFDAQELLAGVHWPRLLVVQCAGAPLAGDWRAACHNAAGTLACGSMPEDPGSLEFLTCFYGQLINAAPLAIAAAEARVHLHDRMGIDRLATLRPEIYGDGAFVPFPEHRRRRNDDTWRQVTVVSIDVDDSMGRMHRLGTERFSELQAAYDHRVAAIVESYGGVADDPQGDDSRMCYFGLPVAREDAAAKAVNAAFELVEAAPAFGLSVRVGVCTGEVVVRDGVPTGDPIVTAARLRDKAGAGRMLVASPTWSIVRDAFRFEIPGHLYDELKGIEKPVFAFFASGKVLSTEQHGATRIANPRMTPFVGRHAELEALDNHWNAACAGSLRLVRIVGEAGIGKSRLVREAKTVLVARGSPVFECRCSPDHTNSAFQPLIEALRAQLNMEDLGDPTTLDRLRHLVARVRADEGTLALAADLLGIAMPRRHPVLDLAPERRRHLTVELLVALAVKLMRESASCMIVEDAHWADPSTADFVNRFAEEGRALPLLIIVTMRTDAHGWWYPRRPVHEMQLRGLSPALSRSMVERTCAASRLPTELVHLIAARADGVPLFIEESTRMAMDVGATGGVLDPTAVPPVPTTLLDLLTARLDQLGPAKPVAQLGAVIGREFPQALIQAVFEHPGSSFPLQDLQVQLAALLRSGVLISRRDDDETRLAFRHVLLRDAAYRSLLLPRRARLHQVIAQVIEERFAGLAQRQPELLAFHLTQARLDSQALHLWEIAARQATARSAHAEAIGHLEQALSVLHRTPECQERDRLELRLQLLLAARLIATHGYGAQSVEQAYARAMALTRDLGDQAALMRVLLGLEGYHFMRANFAQARDYALQAAAVDGHRDSPLHRIQTQWALANILMHQGEMGLAVRQMDECRAEYDRLERKPEGMQNPGVMCLCYSAWSLWELGFPDQALQRVDAVVELAQRLNHSFSLGEAHGFRAAVQHFRGEDQAALGSATTAVTVCEENGFTVWLAHARIMRGRILAELGECAEGIEEMHKGFELWAATGAVVTTPFYLAMRAEALARGLRLDEALALLEQALAIVERTGERYYIAEIRRLTGQILLQRAVRSGQDRAADAEIWLRGALADATSLDQRSLALRAATSLAELWHGQGWHRQAAEVLKPAYDAITEGHTTRDVLQARNWLARRERVESP
ncbi:ATP-binding protein [Scleromatobacter humisilvae]|uniref:AAA family ATPase n=1 Tax=Scleromatobacter humisilvae TaxID=2897159 RepID=A0A9X1YIU3_9BURK|nr:AAA family ATPase [Scleromatobacter humisilvae]MCK9686711.1 AAA family ATPase [Scleromatobacter humisilvae]